MVRGTAMHICLPLAAMPGGTQSHIERSHRFPTAETILTTGASKQHNPTLTRSVAMDDRTIGSTPNGGNMRSQNVIEQTEAGSVFTGLATIIWVICTPGFWPVVITRQPRAILYFLRLQDRLERRVG